MDNPIPDFVLRDFAERCTNPRGAMPRYAHRWWSPGVSADVDTGRARSSQPAYDLPQKGETIRAYEIDQPTAERAVASWDRAHARWTTADHFVPCSELGRTPGAAYVVREGLGRWL
jgi:hypothetical protein